MKVNIFKSSKSEKRALKLLSSSMTNILSIGISTGGSAEINMAKACPNAKIIATTIDKKGLDFTNEALKKYEMAGRIITKIEDVSDKMPYADNTFDFVYARTCFTLFNKTTTKRRFERNSQSFEAIGTFLCGCKE